MNVTDKSIERGMIGTQLFVRFFIVTAFWALASLAPTPTHAAGIVGLSMPPNNLGLVGYWPFDGRYLTSATATDISGQGNNGILVNGPKPIIGKIGQAMKFDGVSNYISTVNSSGLTFATPFTTSVWIYPTSSSVGHILATNNGVSPYDGIGLEWSASWAGTNRVDISILSTTVSGVQIYTNNALPLNQWSHVVATYDGSSSASGLHIYVNGVLAATTINLNNTSGSFTNRSWRIGASQGTLSGLFGGSLDDVRIYNRALSATEVTQLYNQTSGNKIGASPKVEQGATSGLSAGLVGYWPFDGKYLTSATATDISGQGNNGTLVSSPTPAIGKVGQALNIAASDARVNIANPGSGVLDVKGDFTVSLWGKFKGFVAQGSGCNNFITKNYLGSVACQGGSGYDIGFMAPNIPYFIVGTSSSPWATAYFSSTSLADNKWHLYTGTVSGSLVSAYLDGVLKNTAVINQPSTAISTGDIGIGSGNNQNGGAARNVNGAVDDVRIYNRALSATEVTQLYNQTSGNKIGTSPKVQQGATSGLSAGLVGYWPFDGKYLTSATATDISGQGNNGTLVNGPKPAIGRVGQALNFLPLGASTNNYITMGNVSSLDFNTGDFTISVWTKNKGYVNQGSGVNILAGKEAISSCGAGYHLGYISNNLPRFWIADANCTHSASVTHTVNIADNKWHLITGVKSGTNINIAVDGVFTTSVSASSVGSISNSFPFVVSNDGYKEFRNINGAIDDLRVYNRALSAEEVMQLYKQGSGR